MAKFLDDMARRVDQIAPLARLVKQLDGQMGQVRERVTEGYPTNSNMGMA